MNITPLFPAEFYVQFKAPNHKEIISILDSVQGRESKPPPWSVNCNVKTSTLTKELCQQCVAPSLEEFSNRIQYKGQFNIQAPWVNFYTRGDFQEVHYHSDADFAAVFFANVEDNFSKFYFHNRLAGLVPPKIHKLLNLGDCWVPGISSGDIIFFPAYLLHGVTPHQSDVTRKTLAFNFTLSP